MNQRQLVSCRACRAAEALLLGAADCCSRPTGPPAAAPLQAPRKAAAREKIRRWRSMAILYECDGAARRPIGDIAPNTSMLSMLRPSSSSVERRLSIRNINCNM